MTNKRKMQRVRSSQTKSIKHYSREEVIKNVSYVIPKPIIPLPVVAVFPLIVRRGWPCIRVDKALADSAVAFYKMMASE